MFKKLGEILITVLGLLLLIYSAMRSLDFIMLTLPQDKQILAYFGLAALDGGLIFWLVNFLYGAQGWQRPISLIMVIIDFLGCVAMFTADTLYNTGKAGMTMAMSANDLQNAVLLLSGVIAVNVGMTVAHHIANPGNMQKMAEEEAQDTIRDMALKEIKANANKLAAELAPMIGMAWLDEQRANYTVAMTGRRRKPAAIPAEVPTSIPAAIPAMAMMTVKAAEVTLPELTGVLPEKKALPEKEDVPENPTRPVKSRIRKTN